jgi:hypothetical protein
MLLTKRRGIVFARFWFVQGPTLLWNREGHQHAFFSAPTARLLGASFAVKTREQFSNSRRPLKSELPSVSAYNITGAQTKQEKYLEMEFLTRRSAFRRKFNFPDDSLLSLSIARALLSTVYSGSDADAE